MKCRKQLILNGYRVQYVDLREPKPRTHQEQIHVEEAPATPDSEVCPE